MRLKRDFSLLVKPAKAKRQHRGNAHLSQYKTSGAVKAAKRADIESLKEVRFAFIRLNLSFGSSTSMTLAFMHRVEHNENCIFCTK